MVHPLYLGACHPHAVCGVGEVAEHQTAVNRQVVPVEVLRMSYLMHSLVGDTVELAVLHVYVVHGICEFLVLVSHYHYAVLALLACHVLHIDVLHRGIETSAAHLFRLIVGVYLQHRLLALSYFHIAEIYVLHDTATTGVCLDAKHALKVGGVHLTVLDEHVLASA